MAIIKFTRMERDNKIIRKFGEFSFVSTPERCYVDGVMQSTSEMRGDRELTTMAEEAEQIWNEHLAMRKKKDVPYHPPAPNRGKGNHPKAGPYVVVQGIGLLIKISGRGTEIRANEYAVGPMTGDLLRSVIEHREIVRTECHLWSRREA